MMNMKNMKVVLYRKKLNLREREKKFDTEENLGSNPMDNTLILYFNFFLKKNFQLT